MLQRPRAKKFCCPLIFSHLIADLLCSCLWNAGLNHGIIFPCQDGMSRRSSSYPIIYPSSTEAYSCADAQRVMHSSALRARRSAHAGLHSFASCPQRWRLCFLSRLKHSMRGYKNFISILRQSTMCAAIRQSVAMHTMKRRFGGSKQRMIISKLNSTTRNRPSACCPPRNNDAAGAPRPRRPPPQPCLLSRRRREREPLRGPHARMTRRTTTRLFSRHPVQGREGAKQGRQFMYQNSVCTYCAYIAYLLYSALQTYSAYFAYYIFWHILRILHILHIGDLFYVVEIHFALVASCLWILVLYHDSSCIRHPSTEDPSQFGSQESPRLTLKWMRSWTASSACMLFIFCIFCIFDLLWIFFLCVYVSGWRRTVKTPKKYHWSVRAFKVTSNQKKRRCQTSLGSWRATK